MEPIYRQQFHIDPTAVDCCGRLKPSTLLLFAQEVAGHHSDLLSLTYDGLAARGLFWAVIRNRVQVTRLPREGETITLETWPMPTTRTAYPRSTVAYDEQGNELFRSVSLWVLMDLNTRAMILPGFTDLDVDRHMNNARYLDWIMDLLPSSFHRTHPVKDFTLCYMNEALEGQSLDVTWAVDDEGALQVDIHRQKQDAPEDYDRIFAAKVEFQDVVL